MGALITHVAGLHGNGARELMLDGRIPCIDRGQAHLLRVDPCAHAVGIKVISVGSGGLAIENGSRIQGRWSDCQVEHALPGIGWVDALYPQDRQVLRDAVAKDGTEGSHIEGTAITGADHGLGTYLVSKT